MMAVQMTSALQAGDANTISARLETRKIGGRRVMGLKRAVAIPIYFEIRAFSLEKVFIAGVLKFYKLSW